MNTSTSRAHVPTTRATASTAAIPAVAAGLQRPTIEREWWSVTTVRWNELLVEAASDNRTKATTAITTLRKYHDANVIMSSDAGKDAPAGHCKQCWDKKKNVPKRRCRVFAIHIDGQSLACAFCRLKGAGGCDANPKEEEEEAPNAATTTLLTRMSERENQQKEQQHMHDAEIAVLHQKLTNESTLRQDLSKRVIALEAMIAAAATIFSQ